MLFLTTKIQFHKHEHCVIIFQTKIKQELWHITEDRTPKGQPDLHINSNRDLFALIRNIIFEESLGEIAMLTGIDLLTNLFENELL